MIQEKKSSFSRDRTFEVHVNKRYIFLVKKARQFVTDEYYEMTNDIAFIFVIVS